MIHLKLQSPQNGKQEFAVLFGVNTSNIKCDEELFKEVSKHENVVIRKFIKSWELGPEEKISSKEFCLTWRGD